MPFHKQRWQKRSISQGGRTRRGKRPKQGLRREKKESFRRLEMISTSVLKGRKKVEEMRKTAYPQKTVYVCQEEERGTRQKPVESDGERKGGSIKELRGKRLQKGISGGKVRKKPVGVLFGASDRRADTVAGARRSCTVY